MSRFIERALSEPFSATFAEPVGWAPAVDIVETPKEFTLTAELPGMDLKDVTLSVEDGVLTLRGEKVEERKEEENKKVYLYERTYGAFQRSFALPAGVDSSKVSAEFQKGVLKVHIPKDGEAVPKGRTIEIKSV
jgi:HSP20 family protein